MTEYFVILTLNKPTHNGFTQMTITHNITARPGATRASIFTKALENAPEPVRGGSIVFFSIEPNTLGGAE